MAFGTTLKRALTPRKIAFAVGGVFLLLTASGAAAYLMGGADLLRNSGSLLYGLDCTVVQNVAFTQHDGGRWVRKYIKVEGSDGPGRVRTAVRVARDAAGKDKADLVLVVVLDAKGPDMLAGMRGHAIGAEVVYAPHPARVAAADAMFTARYVKAPATDAGEFFGDRVTLSPSDIDLMASEMAEPYGCKDPAAEAEAEAQAKAAAHAPPAKAHH